MESQSPWSLISTRARRRPLLTQNHQCWRGWKRISVYKRASQQAFSTFPPARNAYAFRRIGLARLAGSNVYLLYTIA